MCGFSATSETTVKSNMTRPGEITVDTRREGPVLINFWGCGTTNAVVPSNFWDQDYCKLYNFYDFLIFPHYLLATTKKKLFAAGVR